MFFMTSEMLACNIGAFETRGNICRSPMAEAVFAHLVEQRGLSSEWKIDSAGLGGWHAGSPPDPRASAVLKEHKISYGGVARQIEDSDYFEFDYIFGMDENNISNLKGEAPKESKAEILLLGDFDPKGERIIRDPYYDKGRAGFDKCYEQCIRCCNAFLDKIK